MRFLPRKGKRKSNKPAWLRGWKPHVLFVCCGGVDWSPTREGEFIEHMEEEHGLKHGRDYTTEAIPMAKVSSRRLKRAHVVATIGIEDEYVAENGKHLLDRPMREAHLKRVKRPREYERIERLVGSHTEAGTLIATNPDWVDEHKPLWKGQIVGALQTVGERRLNPPEKPS
jgi:hypothetical protein